MGSKLCIRQTWKRLVHTIAQVQPLTEKLIKPSSPTPSTHRLHKLSLLEQAQTHTYVPIGLFYSKEQLGEFSNHPTQISNILATSLSKTLELYYPYAGCLKDRRTIECNDVGAKFVQVKINSPMSQVVNHPNSDIKDLIFPKGLPWANDSPHYDGLSVLQLSYFDCGGIAISTCLSHKIGDGYSVYHFLKDWAALTRVPNAILSSPYFVQDSLYPSLPDGMVSPEFGSVLDGCIQKRYMFSSSQLRALKTYVAEDSGVQNPTRTEVISALIFKCFAAIAKANSGSFRNSTLVHFANERGFYPNLPSKSIGNVITNFCIPIAKEGDMNVPKIVSSIRREKQVFYNKDNVKKNKWATDIYELAKKGGELSYSLDSENEYVCTSLLQLPLHEVDFGWGKPVRTTIANGPNTNGFGIMDQGSEVEACVLLTEQDVPVFESDAQLFKFASSLPNN
ncbi:hypothetical protein HAX54_038657 [Datura stramonium]|uniref:Acylsugar acyltransferase 3-like n=1 Tax=Datura stramonium TaxID=4076 RepID=A0ABS8SIH3_DATST|nr:hypothetical protein [Datura stramonium]